VVTGVGISQGGADYDHFRVFGKSPCEKFSRATFSPARMSRWSISGDSDAGPMVATILVLWIGNGEFMGVVG